MTIFAETTGLEASPLKHLAVDQDLSAQPVSLLLAVAYSAAATLVFQIPYRNPMI